MQHIFLKPVIQGAHQVGEAEEPPLDGGLLQLYANPLEHRYLTVEWQVVGQLANREFRQCSRPSIAFCKGFRRSSSREYLVIGLAHGLVTDDDSHVCVRSGNLQMFGGLHIVEQDPLVLMAEVAVGIDVLFHVTEVLRQFLS